MNIEPTTSYRPLRDLLEVRTRYFFFTGKGGVGKTSLASGTALALAEQERKVLLVSTDPASNLDEVLGVDLARELRPVPGANGLFALNIDPEAVAAEYREKIIGPMRGLLPESSLKAMEEQLSGACTMEIASFDEFTSYLASSSSAADFDHVVFDTAPTGHTLRLMALSQAWTTFFDESASGNSCLGPLSGLEKQRQTYAEAVEVLKDTERTSVVLVSRAQKSALKEARRTWTELRQLGIENQCLAINSWFESQKPEDAVAEAWERRQREAVELESEFIGSIPLYRAPLLSANLIGLDILRAFFRVDGAPAGDTSRSAPTDTLPEIPNLDALTDRLVSQGRGVILTMGKGGVGKTTVAAALALALSERGARVRLSTTDPAAHLADALGNVEGLTVERIDPKTETKAYVEEVLAEKGRDMDAESRALLEEDLSSPCTEEIAVFRAFARTVAQGEDGFVVLDTAPTGHTLLLLDATQSYHRELERQSRSKEQTGAVKKLLPRLRDPDFTRVMIVTLPEATPVHEAAALQADLERAGITPQAWVINQSLGATNTSEPLLRARSRAEARYIREVLDLHAKGDVYLIPWSATEPVGEAGLRSLLTTTTIPS